jgi:hypothetical protein
MTRAPMTSSKIRFVIVSRCYTLVEFLTSMVLWKGWWELCGQVRKIPIFYLHTANAEMKLIILKIVLVFALLILQLLYLPYVHK